MDRVNQMSIHTDLLLRAGRLLLEYNESTEAIVRALKGTAQALTGRPCQVAVFYRGLTVSLAGERPVLETVGELRYNTALQARVHEILEQVRWGKLDASAALDYLTGVETYTRRHSPWLAAVLLAIGAASLAWLLGADVGAAATAGVATGVGLVVRQWLGRRHVSLFALPFAAALIGAVFGGFAIRWGWTRTPELVLVVPALMVVPGPHLINGLLDLIDNHLPMCLARFGLALGILLASAAGIVVGVELMFPEGVAGDQVASSNRLNLVSDMLLAGIVTSGFAVFYNTAWRHLGMAIAGGMASHGLRFLALQAGSRLEVATFLGGLAVGAISAWMTYSRKVPVAVLAFAGAVSMIPGLYIYRALGGALQMARQEQIVDAAAVSGLVGNALQACLVVGGLALGLLVGARAVLALVKEPEPPTRSGEAMAGIEELGSIETVTNTAGGQ
jgi:uncharacterized membrane protein YjjP (DUF1212 family)